MIISPEVIHNILSSNHKDSSKSLSLIIDDVCRSHEELRSILKITLNEIQQIVHDLETKPQTIDAAKHDIRLLIFKIRKALN